MHINVFHGCSNIDYLSLKVLCRVHPVVLHQSNKPMKPGCHSNLEVVEEFVVVDMEWMAATDEGYLPVEQDLTRVLLG